MSEIKNTAAPGGWKLILAPLMGDEVPPVIGAVIADRDEAEAKLLRADPAGLGTLAPMSAEEIVLSGLAEGEVGPL